MKFSKKPMVVEAMQFDGSPDRFEQIMKWAGPDAPIVMLCSKDDPKLEVTSFTSIGYAKKGDWVIKVPGADFYPCKDGIFQACYDLYTEAEAVDKKVVETKLTRKKK